MENIKICEMLMLWAFLFCIFCVKHMRYSIALDIGATKILGGVARGNKVVYKIKRPTQSKSNKKKVLANICEMIEVLKDKNELKNDKLIQIGIGIAGQVNIQTGIVVATGNFDQSFRNVKLAQILRHKFSVPVKVENDVKCFTLAEMKYGAGRGLKNVVGLTFGTGIGGAIVVQGKLWRGANNTAGEVGHMKIAGEWIGAPPLCGRGEKHCWESMASGWAWQKIHKKYNRQKADEIVAHNIVIGLMNLCQIINPESFILGGGLMEHSDMLPKIKKEFLKRAEQPWFKQVKIVRAKLGDEAILLGALL